ncbi:MAG: hypothetical protein WCJ59_00780 [bacterium]
MKNLEFNLQNSIQELAENFTVKTVQSITNEELTEIKTLDDSMMPEQMQYDLKDLRESFESANGVYILVRNNLGKIVGYLSSLPKNEEYDGLVEFDPEFAKNNSSLYIESILIKGGDLTILKKVFSTLTTEAKNKGYTNISMHTRVSQGLSDILQKRYGVKFFRRIENWYGFGEPFDYLEFDLAEPTRV